ncbi:PQQ-binding-like beta-propeller repeat protein [Nonomuraea sp. NPDC026600]|uniref:outer membrane protein assembly factor BamB family protein n=1 Tax=Nonomuraea sp. NPDC026600 TaxID=3155363 RepID=UPI0033FCA9D6
MKWRAWDGWRWIIVTALIGVLTFALGILLRSGDLATAANIAQLISLLPIVAALIGWAGQSRGSPDGDEIGARSQEPSGASETRGSGAAAPVRKEGRRFSLRMAVAIVATLAIALAGFQTFQLLSRPEPWTRTTGDAVQSSPAEADGVVYVGSDDGKVYALDARTGHINWTFTTGGPVHTRPDVANGVVYIASRDGKVYALSATTGKIRWTYVTQKAAYARPTVQGDVVYVGSEDHNLYALDALTGEISWKFAAKGGIYTG